MQFGSDKFIITDRFAFMQPIYNCHRGFVIDPSQLQKDTFDIETFFMPLYIPVTDIVRGIGWTVGGSSASWTKESVSDIVFLLKRDALPLFTKAVSDEDLLDITLEKVSFNSLHKLQSQLALAVRLRNMQLFDKIYSEIKEKLYVDHYDWHRDILQRIEFIKENLLHYDLLMKYFDKCREENIQVLGIKDFVN
ncbi:hypothetical protein AGMMS49579_08190 [Spirochaetia bacterium]|nr:hypothetical protein AGMMS49579_08190 [Spirochaetia bacterium]